VAEQNQWDMNKHRCISAHAHSQASSPCTYPLLSLSFISFSVLKFACFSRQFLLLFFIHRNRRVWLLAGASLLVLSTTVLTTKVSSALALYIAYVITAFAS